MLSFRDRYMRDAPALPLRLKHNNIIPRREDGAATRAIRENFRDRLFQEEALRELREAYQFSSSQFDTVQTDFINHYLEVAFLLLAARSFLRHQSDQIVIKLESLITGMGAWEIQYLTGQYFFLLKAMDIQLDINVEKNTIYAEGHSLYELFQGEAGIHLFYIAHQNPLPIRVTVQRVGNSNGASASHQVIRIYDGSSTLTDLRSGFSNTLNMTPSELKLLLYAGLEKEVRNILLKTN